MGETLLFRPLILLPSYNNARTLSNILERAEALDVPILVVNDGATDATAKILTDWQSKPRSLWTRVLTHPRNRGKAAALKTGFAAAHEAGYTHAVTIDTDG